MRSRHRRRSPPGRRRPAPWVDSGIESTAYDYTLKVRDESGNAQVRTATFITFKRQVTVTVTFDAVAVIDAVTVIDDSDDLSEGDLAFWFGVNRSWTNGPEFSGGVDSGDTVNPWTGPSDAVHCRRTMATHRSFCLTEGGGSTGGRAPSVASGEIRMIDVAPLTPTIGAEVRGLDLADPLDDATKADLDKAWGEHKVLFFRDQGHISTEAHVAFCRAFGELEIHPFVPPKPGFGEVMVLIANEDRKGNENTWHSDVTWRQEPSLGSMLRAVEIPPVGGDTLFADMEAAYESLGEKMREMVDGLVAVHDFTRVFGRRGDPEKLAALRETYPPAEHPVIRTHPVSGRKSIYVNDAFTSHIVGLHPDESASLLAHLYARAAIPEHQCRFRWEPGSFALWDNRCAQHYATSDYYPQRRVMERVTIVGDRPR